MEAGGNMTASPIMFHPGVGSSYDNGWRQLWRNFGSLLLTGIIVFLLIVPVAFVTTVIFTFVIRDSLPNYTGTLSGFFDEASVWGFYIVIYILNIVYFMPLSFGLLFVYMTAARGNRVELGNIFASFKNYGNVVLVGILYFVLYGGASILLELITRHLPVLGILLTLAWVVFATIIICKLAFVPYLLLDKKMKAIDSIRTSWTMTNGHAGKVFLIGLLSIPVVIAGLICLLVGVIISYMWITMAIGSLYHAVNTSVKVKAPLPF